MKASDRKCEVIDLETDTLFIFNDELFVTSDWDSETQRVECVRVGHKNSYGKYRFSIAKCVYKQSFTYHTEVIPVE